MMVGKDVGLDTDSYDNQQVGQASTQSGTPRAHLQKASKVKQIWELWVRECGIRYVNME